MLLNNIMGGIGNQLFQFVAGHCFSKKFTLEHTLLTDMYSYKKMHNGFEIDKLFDVEIPMRVTENSHEFTNNIILNSIRLRKIFYKLNLPYPNLITERNYNKNSPEHGINLSSGNQYLFYGYWQSFEYFLDFENEIKKMLIFKSFQDYAFKSVEEVIKNSNSIGVHIRRGDYLTSKASRNLHGLNINDYYKNAIHHFLSLNSDCKFFFFSDDIDFVSNYFKDYNSISKFININQGENSYKDLCLMSLCKSLIIANSTFSWWAAFLNSNSNKTVIIPKNWFNDGRSNPNIYFKEWIKM